MKKQDISEATDPDLRGSLAAIVRAAASARETAMQTGTAIIVMRDNKMVRVTAEELRAEMKNKTELK